MRFLTAILFISGILLFGDGLVIQAKARLAAWLIEDAWSQSLSSGTPVAPWPWADTWPVARLQVPRLGIDHYVLAGAHGSALAFGPGHLDGSPMPGFAGTSVVAGHRDTHFRFLETVRPDDEVRLQRSDGAWFTYDVAGSEIADTSASPLWTLPATNELHLVTCYPFDAIHAGGSQRYIVKALPRE